ncbi:MAG: TolC family protein [Candidatus Methylomirabilales bacterium]
MRRHRPPLWRPVVTLALLAAVLPWGVAGAGESAPPLQLRLRLAQVPPGAAPAGPGVRALSLREGIALAIQNNLDVAVEGYTPRVRDQELTQERAVFDPSAFLEATRTDVRRPPLFSLTTTGTDAWDFNTGVRQRLPTGGIYELRLDNEYSNTVSNATDGFSSRLALTLTQPLLRNFGYDANLTNIRIATNNQSISREQLRLRVADVVTQVQNAYFDLIFALENLEVQRRSLRLAQELVALNRARVRAGVAAPVEVTQAEAQEAARQQDVILAEKAVRDAEDTLKVVLNLPSTAGWDQELRPTDPATFEAVQVNLDEAIRQALANRNEYRSAKLDVDNRDLTVRLTRNQLLPDLSLQGSVSLGGAGETYGRNLGELSSTEFTSYSVGVVLTVPIGNRAAQAGHLRARLLSEQARTSLKQLELLIVQQVREAVRRVEADARRVEANRAARVLAEEQLRVEQRRLEAGVTTTFNVLSFQRDLAAAQANEIRAITDYNKSLAVLDRVRGIVLERHRIEL